MFLIMGANPDLHHPALCVVLVKVRLQKNLKSTHYSTEHCVVNTANCRLKEKETRTLELVATLPPLFVAVNLVFFLY